MKISYNQNQTQKVVYVINLMFFYEHNLATTSKQGLLYPKKISQLALES